ncbi:Putative SOS response-associated peptidase YedK [Ruegeria halocynthiae]|uniref:Abasic site processing protein n=1 Tax=Ruegeria halocynthiae TaxID=985054 RepID=A0A1H2Z237_9RHOB|nr:SOS response-associated peptidase [Ruegeria halocynthiae]SDX11068.1 Putative SOS response-associated peptidase YedK [Ruegeria halocynthiae]
MPGRFFLTRPVAEIALFLNVEDDLGPQPARRNIQPGQEVTVLTGDGLTTMRWGMIPVGRVNARGRPVMETIINARSETVFDKSAFEGVGRAVIPVDGWYEWTGEKRRKKAWRIAAKDGTPLLFAAITDTWEAPGGQRVDQVAAVTCEPNADVKPIHHRMGVLLDAKDVKRWLQGTEEKAQSLMRPWPEGQLRIEEANDVDWTAA